MKISVITPLYKGKKYIDNLLKMHRGNVAFFIEKCLDVQIEYIFVNDYPDERIEINDGINVKLINNEKNIGIHQARLVGLKVAQGEFIHFLDQDDIITEDFYYKQLSAIGDADVVIANGYTNNGIPIMNEQDYEGISNSNSYLQSPWGIHSPGQALIRRQSIPNSWKDHSLKNNNADDVFLWILMANQGKRFVINPDFLYTHITSGTNASNNRERGIKSYEEILELIDTYKLISSENLSIVKAGINRKIALEKNLVICEQGCTAIKNNPEALQRFLGERGIANIAIYGYGNMGRKFVDVLKNISLKPIYVIDRNAKGIESDFQVYYPDENFPEVDVIVVTPVSLKEDIVTPLSKRTGMKVVMLYELMRDFLNAEHNTTNG